MKQYWRNPKTVNKWTFFPSWLPLKFMWWCQHHYTGKEWKSYFLTSTSSRSRIFLTSQVVICFENGLFICCFQNVLVLLYSNTTGLCVVFLHEHDAARVSALSLVVFSFFRLPTFYLPLSPGILRQYCHNIRTSVCMWTFFILFLPVYLYL